ncbi:hypothetical protein BGX34_009238 [Mortierella sp. NVP85]|nr:hypothetical protein BGX34_009238 [Mortierella sp. NVP85]
MLSRPDVVIKSQETTPSRTPLEIPEILLRVAQCLADNDLTRCLRVCKNWRDLILPVLWRKVRVDRGQHSRSSGPDPVFIYRHRHLIYDLVLLGNAGLDKHIYPNLKRLTLDSDHYTKDLERIVNLDFMEMFPSLLDLKLDTVNVSVRSWLIMSMHHHLRDLGLYRIEVKAIDAAGFWRACANLESLRLGEVTIAGGGVPSNMVFRRMRKLSIATIKQMDTIAQLNLILQCPRLEELTWLVLDSGQYASRPFGHLIPQGMWPDLRRLSIVDSIADSDFAAILEGAGGGHGGLVHLEFMTSILQGPAFRALHRHFDTLVHLDCQSYPSLVSPIIREVLCGCPRLEALKTGTILAKDIAEGGPWVCRSLQELKICFWFGNMEQDLQQSVFERLSTLNRLERLTLYHHGTTDSVEGGNMLEFRLDRGLGQLASIQLKYIMFGAAYVAQLSMEEVEWMATNWKGLKQINGKLNDDPVVEISLATALQGHGINYHR